MWVNFFDHFSTSTGVSWANFYSVVDTLALNAGEASADQNQHPIPDDSFGDFWYVRPALTDPTITVIARDDWTSYETVCVTNPQWDGITPPIFPIIGALFRVRIRNVNRNGGGEVPLTLFAGPAFPLVGGPPPFQVALDAQNIAVFDTIPGGDPDYVSDWIELPVVPPNPPDAPEADWSWLAVIPSGDSVTEFTYEVEWQIWVDDSVPDQLNCDCDSTYDTVTKQSLYERVMRRIGYAAQLAKPPPGVQAKVFDYLEEAQNLAMSDFDEIGHTRYFTWDLEVGNRFYGLDENSDICTKQLRHLTIQAIYLKRGDQWTRLIRGIDPLWFNGGIHNSTPTHYDVRQCLEIWPPTSQEGDQLIVKGQFKKLPFEAADDMSTADPEAIFLRTVAFMKAEKSQPDGQMYAGQYWSYIGNINADLHRDVRYIPSSCPAEFAGWYRYGDRLTRNMDPLIYDNGEDE